MKEIKKMYNIKKEYLVLFTCPEYGGDTFPRNVGSNQRHTVLHPRRRYSS
jgi:hypothetical protein